MQESREIPFSEIYAGQELNHARGVQDKIDVEWLADDILKNGLLQPIAVRKTDKYPGFKYAIVAGFTRTLACKSLGWHQIPATVVECNEMDAIYFNLVENLQRKQLNIVQEANSIRAILARNPNLTFQEIGDRLGKSSGWVQIRFQILRLPDDIQEELKRGIMTVEQIRALISIEDVEKQYEVIRKMKDVKTRGEKRDLMKLVQKKRPISDKAARNRSEMQGMISHLLDTFDGHLAAKALAWAAGNISEIDFIDSIEKECKERGISYIRPTESIGEERL